jgi:3-oxoacyl-[acyl-carrier protein] reductase
LDLGLKGKSVIVLASSKGLGKATAKMFAEEGANVMLASRNEDQLQQTAVEIKAVSDGHVNYQVCNITASEDIEALVIKTVESYGTVDVLVNNAGGPPAGAFDDFSDEAWQGAFELNLLSFIRAIREVLPHMKEQQSGRIVNLASSSFKQPIDGLILSNVFRTGIMGLSKSLSQELAGDNILINTVGPGRVETDRIIELDHKVAEKKGVSFEDIQEKSKKAVPIGRYGTPEEFARMIVFLGSEANTYVTGQALLVDGGMVKAM